MAFAAGYHFLYVKVLFNLFFQHQRRSLFRMAGPVSGVITFFSGEGGRRFASDYDLIISGVVGFSGFYPICVTRCLRFDGLVIG